MPHHQGIAPGDSVGVVTTRRVTLFDASSPLRLTSGAVLAPVEVAYETYGDLSPTRDNAVFVCHALTGDAHAAGFHEGATRPGWWDSMIGPGRPLDTTRMFVVCANLLGGCQGTTGPGSVNPATGAAYGLDFPLLDMADFVTVHRALLAHLGVERLLAAFGGSLGGMQVLEWAAHHPQRGRAAIPIATTAMGKALLCGLPPEEYAYLSDHIRLADEDNWPRIKLGIEQALRDYRERGFCLSVGDWRNDIHAVGVPLLDTEDDKQMAFNCGGPAYLLPRALLENDIGPRLAQLVRKVKTEMGRV